MRDDSEQTDTPESGDEALVARWLQELRISQKREKKWRKEAHETWKVYTASDSTTSFNILYSNVQTIKPAVFNSIPTPDVRRRYKDKDPLGKQMSDIIERALAYCMDNDYYSFYDQVELAVIDYLVTGRGWIFADYAFETRKVSQEVQNPDGTMQLIEADEIAAEHVFCEHYPYNRVLVHSAPKWAAVRWVAIESFPTEEEARALFPDLPPDVSLLKTSIENNGDDSIGFNDKESIEVAKADVPDLEKRLQVFKIWDKAKRRVLYISPQVKEKPLAIEDDPFGLPQFFPCPAPLTLLKKTTDLIPSTEYSFYKTQAEELNRVSKRITQLINGLKVRGFYNSTIKEMADLSQAGDFKFVPIDAAVLQESSMDDNIWMMPIDKIMGVIASLVQQREQIKATIYEIIGLSDILRGASDPNETLGAQNIKAQFGGLRIDDRKREIANFIKELLRIKAAIIAKMQPQTLQAMTLIEAPPEVFAQLKDQQLSGYRIDIETDSTVAGNIQDDQKNMTDMLTGIVSYMTGVAPLVQGGAVPIEAAKEILLAAVRRMKLGRTVEDSLESIGAQPMQPAMPQELIGQQLPPQQSGLVA